MGCSVYDLSEKLPPEELELRLVYKMNQLGYTYDRVRIAKIKHDEAVQETKDFLATCDWNK